MNDEKKYCMKKILFLSIVFLSSAFAFAQKTDEKNPEKPVFEVKSYSLSVEYAVELAKKNNVSIARSQITLDAALRTKNHSWNSVSPSLSVGATSSVPLDSLTGGDQKSDYTASFGISATASFSLSANLYTQIQSAKLAYDQQKITFDDAVRKIELSVRQSYYGLIYEKENIKLQEENLKIAKNQYESNLAKYNAGRLSEVDALSAEVNYKSKIPNFESSQTTFQNDMDSFKQVLGLMLYDDVALTGSLDDYLYLDEIKVDLKDVKSAEVDILKSKIDSAKISVMDKRFSAFAPSVSASLSWRDASWYAGYDGTAPDAAKSASVTLSATIPLDGVLPWSSKNDAVDSAKDSVKDYELQFDDALKNVKRSVDADVRSIKQSQAAIRYKQSNVELAQKTYDMTSEAYSRGTKDLLTLQNANSTLLEAKVSLNNEILTLAKDIMSLEYTIGADFGSLTAKN